MCSCSLAWHIQSLLHGGDIEGKQSRNAKTKRFRAAAQPYGMQNLRCLGLQARTVRGVQGHTEGSSLGFVEYEVARATDHPLSEPQDKAEKVERVENLCWEFKSGRTNDHPRQAGQ